MTWTSEKPTAPGYYWNQSDGSMFPRILCVCEAASGLVVFNTGNDRPPYLANYNPPGSQWAGPILPPVEAQV